EVLGWTRADLFAALAHVRRELGLVERAFLLLAHDRVKEDHVADIALVDPRLGRLPDRLDDQPARAVAAHGAGHVVDYGGAVREVRHAVLRGGGRGKHLGDFDDATLAQREARRLDRGKRAEVLVGGRD